MRKPKVIRNPTPQSGIHPICQTCYFNRVLEGRLRAPVEVNFPYCGGDTCCFCGGFKASHAIYMKAKKGEAYHCRGNHSVDDYTRVTVLPKSAYEAYAATAEKVRKKSIMG